MKLKRITAVAIIVFAAILVFFLIAGYVFYHAPSPSAKPSPAQISAEENAAKSGLFDPAHPAIVH